MAATHPALANRDTTLDLARVACVLLVVAIHLLFVGVGPDGRGGIAVSRPLEEQPWFAAATWAGQIMPLFFVVGGFATATSLRSHRRRIPDRRAADRAFVQGRMLRLVRPAAPLFVLLVLALFGAMLLGAPSELVRAVAVGVGSPLWFLCAYLICQSLAPALLDAHERAPRRTPLLLLLGVAVVDTLQFSLPGVPVDAAGMSVLGYLNLLLVWPLVQLLGFWYADGWFARRRTWQLAAIAVAGWAALVPMTLWGSYSDDMLTNLNPPTLPLVALGLGQAALLRLLHRPLAALMRTRLAQAIVFAFGTRLMTVYLWHLPVIVAVAGIGLLLPGTPAPGDGAWWALRPLVAAVVLAAVLGLSVPLARFERPRAIGAAASGWRLLVAALATILPTAAITILGLDAWLALAGAAGFGLALLVLRPAQAPAPPASPSPSLATAPEAAAGAGGS